MTEVEEKTDPGHQGKNPTGRSSVVGCLVKGILALVVIAAVLVTIQSFIAPEVEDDSTVEIRTGSGAADDLQQTNDNDSSEPKKLSDTISMKQIESADHPLDPLMQLADRSLELIDSEYSGYSAKILTQVRTGDTLHEENLMLVKVRHARAVSDENPAAIPFSIYTRFLKPKAKVGQEAIWVEGKDDEKILGHGTGLLNIKTVRLDPEGDYAMTGNRYPIFQIGFRNLIVKMKEFGENDRKYGECEVQIDKGVEVDGRPCTLLTVTHPEKREHFDYHIAKIYIDDEYEAPTGYEGYLWPESPGDDPPLLEKYFYLDVKLNIELEDIDFDITNPEYEFPAW